LESVLLVLDVISCRHYFDTITHSRDLRGQMT
jgi:hypothetical protein